MNALTNEKSYLSVLKKFRLIFGAVQQHFRDVDRQCGVSGSQLWILQLVAEHKGIGVSRVAERLSIHQSTCSQLVEKLVAKGLICKVRGAEDQRRVSLQITPKAYDVLANAPGPASGALTGALMAMPESVLLALDNNLEQLIGEIHGLDEKAAEIPLADL